MPLEVSVHSMSSNGARAVHLLGSAVLVALLGWSFLLALDLPLDSWDAYDYLINARWLAGHDLTRLSQNYRVDRPPGISLLVAPLLASGYAPGQRGAAGLIHLVPWGIGIWGLVLLWRTLRTSVGDGLAFCGVLLLALNPLFLHFLPFVMADVPSMTFSLLTLIAAERAVTTRRGIDFIVLALSVAAAMLSKYPVAALGLAIPIANLVWSLAGRDRPRSLREKLLSIVQPRLAIPLLLGLALFLLVQAVIFSRFVPGDGSWWQKLSAGLTSAWGSAGGGSAGGETDPRSEIPTALLALFGAPAVFFAALGAIRTVASRDRRALYHLSFFALLLAMFVFLIGHKESRYAFPLLPSFVFLVMYGLAWIPSRVALAVAAVVTLGAALPMSFAEFQRMNDPLYRRPSILAWARFALDRAGADRPIFQLPVLPAFGLYPKNPVVLPMDEFWHYHHFNEGGLVWFFDRRLQALQAQPGDAPSVRHESPWYFVTVPQTWLQSAGEDAVWLSAFPTGAVLLSTSQGWYETRTAASQPEPPAPFVAIDLRVSRLERTTLTPDSAVYSDIKAARSEAGWAPTGVGPETHLFVRDVAGVPIRWSQPLPEAPLRVEVVTREQVLFPIR